MLNTNVTRAVRLNKTLKLWLKTPNKGLKGIKGKKDVKNFVEFC